MDNNGIVSWPPLRLDNHRPNGTVNWSRLNTRAIFYHSSFYSDTNGSCSKPTVTRETIVTSR